MCKSAHKTAFCRSAAPLPAGTSCRQSVKSATLDGVKATTSWSNEGSVGAAVFKLVSLNYTSLPAAGRTLCIELAKDSACANLSSFCRGSDFVGRKDMCTYSLFSGDSQCCPTDTFAIA